MVAQSCSLEGWPSLGNIGGLFVGVGNLEDSEILVVAADDLDANGEALWREAGRDGDGRVACD